MCKCKKKLSTMTHISMSENKRYFTTYVDRNGQLLINIDFRNFIDIGNLCRQNGISKAKIFIKEWLVLDKTKKLIQILSVKENCLPEQLVEFCCMSMIWVHPTLAMHFAQNFKADVFVSFIDVYEEHFKETIRTTNTLQQKPIIKLSCQLY